MSTQRPPLNPVLLHSSLVLARISCFVYCCFMISYVRKLEDGLRLVVRNENTQVAAAAAAAAADAATAAPSAAAVVERSPQELSGGQQALLGLALVLALSSYQAPPLCLLDEVDAALDETNQVMIYRQCTSIYFLL